MANDQQVVRNLDPRWTARIYSRTGGLDFLGLRAVQGNMTNYLLPGITTITPRARYYAFYTWVLVEYGERHPDGWSLARFMRRREQLFALANLAYRGSSDENPSTSGLTGTDKLGAHLSAHGDAESIPLNADRVSRYVKARYGGYDAYSGPMRKLELIRDAEGNNNALEVLPKGQRLAQTFAEAVQDTKYYQDRIEYDTAPLISRSVLEEYGRKCHLSHLAESPDREPTLEVLFPFNAEHLLPRFDSDLSTVGNARGSLGVILDILDQVQGPFTEEDFRQAVTYGLCPDFPRYRPSLPLEPFVAHWQMFQLREYYVYALYALWVYFLRWLRLEGPQTLQTFHSHLNDAVDLTAASSAIGITLPSRAAEEWALEQWLEIFLDACGVPGGDRESRYRSFTERSQTPLNEHRLYQLIERTQPDDPSTYIGATWLLLTTLYLRLRGLRENDRWEVWHWAETGGPRRRAMALFLRDIANRKVAGCSLLDTWSWLYRDYIVAQHTITALEKWRARKSNTFHFNYEDGYFEWVQDDEAGFSASRFPQAYAMLADLGLYEIDPEEGIPRLTSKGDETLQRVLKSCDD